MNNIYLPNSTRIPGSISQLEEALLLLQEESSDEDPNVWMDDLPLEDEAEENTEWELYGNY